eukprot:4427332-Heterocapsa_arctica.AAC.1
MEYAKDRRQKACRSGLDSIIDRSKVPPSCASSLSMSRSTVSNASLSSVHTRAAAPWRPCAPSSAPPA